MMAAVVQEAEERLAQRRHEAAQAKSSLTQALADLQRAQDQLVSSKLDAAIASQRRVEEEALQFTKSVNTLYQRAAKWKAEQKRLRASLDALAPFEDWALHMESDLHAIAGNLEYVCAVLEREHADRNGSSNGNGSSSS